MGGTIPMPRAPTDDFSRISRRCAQEPARIYGGLIGAPSENSRGFCEGAQRRRVAQGISKTPPGFQTDYRLRPLSSLIARRPPLLPLRRGGDGGGNFAAARTKIVGIFATAGHLRAILRGFLEGGQPSDWESSTIFDHLRRIRGDFAKVRAFRWGFPVRLNDCARFGDKHPGCCRAAGVLPVRSMGVRARSTESMSGAREMSKF
jgi:hypothetical protein